MKDKIQFIALPAILLLIFFFGKLLMSRAGLPYETGLKFFSMVTMQVHLAVLWAAVSRRYKGYNIWSAIQIGFLITIVSQLLIIMGTGLSYTIGDTHFNYPAALNQEEPIAFGAAMTIRASGLVVNSMIGGVAGLIGWLLGSLIPSDSFSLGIIVNQEERTQRS